MALSHYRKSALNDIRFLATDAPIICRSLGIPKEILLEIIKHLCLQWKSYNFNWHFTFNINKVQQQFIDDGRYGIITLWNKPYNASSTYMFKVDRVLGPLLVSTFNKIDHNTSQHLIKNKIAHGYFPKALQLINGKDKNVINYLYWLKDEQLYELYY